MRINFNHTLNRRTLLRGLGGALALPLLDSMIPARAAAGTKPIIRLGFVYTPNGMIPAGWLPKIEGAGFEITPTMRPLAPFRENLLVLSNLTQRTADALGDGGGDHARAGATWLTGVHPKKTEGSEIHAGISADQIAAKELGKQTQFASLELGIEEPSFAGGCDSGYSCAYTNTISWRGPTTPNPVQISPRTVFERLFGDGESTDPAARLKRMQQDRSILDYVNGDVARLEPKLGTRDKNKLDEYLESIRDIERRIEKAEKPTSFRTPVMARPVGIPEVFDEHARLMSDLMVVAFQTDMTRVITYMFAREGSNRAFPELGVPEGCHVVTHHQNDPVKIAKAQIVEEHRAKSFAYLLKRMSEAEDGDGTLLDHTLLLYGAGIRDGNTHDHIDLPLVLAGGKSTGIKSGRHIRSSAGTPMTNLLTTILDRVGVTVDSLGDSTGKMDQLAGV
jgi:Protein of unknown function (DUF1552)